MASDNTLIPTSSIRLVTSGLSILLALLLGLGILWHYSTLDNKIEVEGIVNGQTKIQIISAMRDAVQKRTLSLARLISLTDPFDIDDEVIRFSNYATQFINARDLLFEYHLNDPLQHKIWNGILQSVNISYQAANKAAELTRSLDHQQASRYFLKHVIPLQDRVLANFNEQLSLVAAHNSEKIQKLSATNDKNHNASTFLILILALFGTITIIIIVTRSKKHENSLIHYANRVRSLYELSSAGGISFDEQIQKMLKLGCRLLNMEIGKFSYIDKENGTHTTQHCYSENYQVEIGNSIPLEQTFCGIAVSTTESIFTIDHVKISEFNQHPCYQHSNLEAYIAARIDLNGKLYGTINFSSHRANKKPFSTTDKDIMKLIANWINFTIENKHTKEELLQTKIEADQANKLKSIFLANMSHELRTPLNAIIGYSELLEEDLKDSPDHTSHQDASKIRQSGVHLLTLINEILDLSKVEAGKTELEKNYIYFDDIISDVNAAIRPLFNKNQNQFSINLPDKDIMLFTDVTKLKQVLINILSNANKFTDHGKINLILAEKQINNKQGIIITIEDTGIGMNNQQLQRIFKPFSQASASVEQTFGGTGLGLTISKKICNLMGGDISVSSALGQGTKFTIELPSNIISQTDFQRYQVA